MNPCQRLSEDIALLAGGDLPAGSGSGTGSARSPAEDHVASCYACARLLADLTANRAWVARAAARPEAEGAPESLVSAVLARAAAEAMADGLFRPPVLRPTHDLGLLAFGRVAAAIAIVGAAGLLGYGLLSHEGLLDDSGRSAQQGGPGPEPMAAGFDLEDVAPAGSRAAAPTGERAAGGSAAEPDAFRPVRVRRAAGEAVALEWDGDGRDEGSEGLPRAYKVLASDSPSDFTNARPVMVAGRNLIAGDRFPAQQRGDRSLTFFRVE